MNYHESFIRKVGKEKVSFDDIKDLICNFLNEARECCGENFSYKAEYEWWIRSGRPLEIHKQTEDFIDSVLLLLYVYNDPSKTLDKDTLFRIYKTSDLKLR